MFVGSRAPPMLRADNLTAVFEAFAYTPHGLLGDSFSGSQIGMCQYMRRSIGKRTADEQTRHGAR
jgi:hypothetical protein